MTTSYPAGAFFLVSVNGAAGVGIELGQVLAGSPSKYQHAGVVIDGDGTTVEAAPGGAHYGHLSAYAGRALLVSDAPVQRTIADLHAAGWSTSVDETRIRLMVTAEAHKLIGIPYSALDYLALALLHLHLPSQWVRRRVEASGHMICSQLVDAVYERSGIHLYDDGRLPGDVMPADLDTWARHHQPVAAA